MSEVYQHSNLDDYEKFEAIDRANTKAMRQEMGYESPSVSEGYTSPEIEAPRESAAEESLEEDKKQKEE